MIMYKYMYAVGALSGIFDQIMGGSDGVREKGIEYVSVSLMDMRHKLLIPSVENEQFLVELIKKVLSPPLPPSLPSTHLFLSLSPPPHLHMHCTRL